MAVSKNAKDAKKRRLAPLNTPSPLGADAVRDISAELNALLADTFALYLKTKNFHWHMAGPYFRDYHLLLDDQADQIYATADPIAERVRKLGGTTLRSTGHITRLQRLSDNDADFVTPADMLAELREDNQRLAGFMRETHVAVRRIRRCRHCQPAGNVDRRSRAADLVPVRIGPADLS